MIHTSIGCQILWDHRYPGYLCLRSWLGSQLPLTTAGFKSPTVHLGTVLNGGEVPGQIGDEPIISWWKGLVKVKKWKLLELTCTHPLRQSWCHVIHASLPLWNPARCFRGLPVGHGLVVLSTPVCKGTTRGCCSLRDLRLSQSSTANPPKTSNATTKIHPSFDMICCIRLVRKPVLQLSMNWLCWEIFAGNETMDFPMNDGLSAENVPFIIFES